MTKSRRRFLFSVPMGSEVAVDQFLKLLQKRTCLIIRKTCTIFHISFDDKTGVAATSYDTMVYCADKKARRIAECLRKDIFPKDREWLVYIYNPDEKGVIDTFR
ncbi:MAG: hypothetical protein UY12_C0001G0011 [Parcubacteria group bacterium GW2011_GWA2_47_8b]|uniref:Uncharacterized protein n=3 Tax=Parcubacteria group TaxID=1794811 RepID=A0A0G1T5J0_9BACT|nr:MAG: hypothetical protein UY02_C0007G0010 [Candidatus Giovannonibacteria bacterium GW2011_GWB1_47_6b]KKU85458.1 MAG: hypothetical protein UY12_C0001G0011 [Parcubacteria group bacterium GW2011_GWA2_47_8b]KKU94784.1 MAG: hypothetical protein UY24_C0009G0028 [Parcubacteria group bacterium GW2011_GWA1_48_11b]OGY64246.1 MAG: hypothetical protein A3E64_01215 [Candidatus Harrisonbacteria bacterium RIFCSPHIGHO2_12_FULL_48_16]OGY69112.1 MAG: hypothetical protein A2214_01830 [Candidatus Harrisonbacter